MSRRNADSGRQTTTERREPEGSRGRRSVLTIRGKRDGVKRLASSIRSVHDRSNLSNASEVMHAVGHVDLGNYRYRRAGESSHILADAAS